MKKLPQRNCTGISNPKDEWMGYRKFFILTDPFSCIGACPEVKKKGGKTRKMWHIVTVSNFLPTVRWQ